MGGINDTAFSSGPKAKVDAIDAPSPWEVEERAQQVVQAACRARQKEIVQEGNTYIDPETGEQYINYNDLATGEGYTYLGNDQWLKRSTGERVGDPRSIDASQYQWVIDKFKYFHERWSAYPLAMATECERAKGAIQSGQMGALLTADQIAWTGWGGDAQRHFTQYFMEPFLQSAITNQQVVLDELAVAMYAYAALLLQARVDAKMAADKAIQVLDGLHDSNAPDAVTTIKLVAMVVGVVGAVAATPATGGGSLALAAGLISAGLIGAEVVAEGISEQQKERDINGGFVHEVLEKLKTALDDMKADMDKVEQNLASEVTEAAGIVDNWLSSTDPMTKASILPNEPTDDGVPNVTTGEAGPGDFRPRQ
jgi:hypothetical protein